LYTANVTCGTILRSTVQGSRSLDFINRGTKCVKTDKQISYSLKTFIVGLMLHPRRKVYIACIQLTCTYLLIYLHTRLEGQRSKSRGQHVVYAAANASEWLAAKLPNSGCDSCISIRAECSLIITTHETYSTFYSHETNM